MRKLSLPLIPGKTSRVLIMKPADLRNNPK